MSKEKAPRPGELIIQTKSTEIVIPSQIPLIGTEINQRRFKKIVSFCRNRRNKYYPDDAGPHTRTTEAIKEAAEAIYQRFFLPPDEATIKVRAFSEVELSPGARVDCVILGQFGVILVETKPSRVSSFNQLAKYKEIWQEIFPEIPVLALRASYRGNKILLLKRNH